MPEPEYRIVHQRDIQSYLLEERNPNRAYVSLLEGSLSIEMLRFLISLDYEVGLAYSPPNWFIIRGFPEGIPSYLFSNKDPIRMHSHYQLAGDEDNSRPSPYDLYNASIVGRNLIIASRGIVEFHPLFEPGTSGMIKRTLDSIFDEITELRVKTEAQYLDLLNHIRARYTLFPWEVLDNEKLEMLLYQES